MDHARRIGKSSDRRDLKKGLTSVNVIDDPILPDELPPEDRHLLNWEKWRKDRKKQKKILSTLTGRDPEEILLNSGDRIRELEEMRILMDHARDPGIPEGLQGNPGFWKLPALLPTRGDLPPVGAALTKKDLNIAPELLNISLPILEGEDAEGGKKSEPRWKRSKYLRKREEELRDRISSLQPHKLGENLVIRGRKFRAMGENPKLGFSRPPVVTVTSGEEVPRSMFDLESSIALKIQDRVITRDLITRGKIPGEISWTLEFQAFVNLRSEVVLRIENCGNVVIAYQWRDAGWKSASLPPPGRRGPCFFFDKNKGVILPGQIRGLPVWFRKKDLGVAVEHWRLETDPKIHPDPLVFRFWGCALEEDPLISEDNVIKVHERSIEGYLDRCIRNSAILEILESIVRNVHRNHPGPFYKSLFLDRDVFEIKNPFHYYHGSLVKGFMEIHRSLSDDPSWNFSLRDLRDSLLEIQHPHQRREALKRFNQLCRQGLEPSLSSLPDKRKHSAVYNVLCTFFNNFQTESEFIKENSAGVLLDLGKSSLTSLTFAKKRSRKSSRAARKENPEDGRGLSFVFNKQQMMLYRETFFVRIYDLLGEVMDQVCAVIDSWNNLNEKEK